MNWLFKTILIVWPSDILIFISPCVIWKLKVSLDKSFTNKCFLKYAIIQHIHIECTWKKNDLFFAISDIRLTPIFIIFKTLFQWILPTHSLQCHHNEHDGVSNHQPLDCLLNRLFRRRSKKTSKLHVTGLREGNHQWPVDSSHKGPVMWKMFPFDDVIMFFSPQTKMQLQIFSLKESILNFTQFPLSASILGLMICPYWFRFGCWSNSLLVHWISSVYW